MTNNPKINALTVRIEDFKMQRLGTIMEPDMTNPMEAGGVLNPAAIRSRDGNLYLFPRMATMDNYSRIGIARVKFNAVGDPCGVERLGIALEPEAEYEKRPNGGGCEDPRITFVEPLDLYLMTYTAFSPEGPRVALAKSADLLHWERLGLANYNTFQHIEFNGINNKDACIFPQVIKDPRGHTALGMLHRPLFPGTSPEEKALHKNQAKRNRHQECIWISYLHFNSEKARHWKLSKFISHHPLAAPIQNWEDLKIGAGTPPILTRHGWMYLYHGVGEGPHSSSTKKEYRYSAGVMILAADNPCKILYRSRYPLLSPDLPEERVGIIADVVFPTGIDRRDDLGKPDRFDVYYGMADNRIGVARLDIPEVLPIINY
ncbi:glycosidase [Mucilaginibacter sabulilitoris]|uniref:Glycosidase n=1 Tax=Mucilaginibacter sabulilitoris TaxID=1173583 RepID=A0ABZ0TV20_9SPHI|nr:glycosidase [Mucilaginibacter sabulilitoris]WPU96959.1 glycosidase [Mucilaginibacter sabulilitoris]